MFGKRGCILASLLYLGKVVLFWQSGCNRAEVVVLGQKWFHSGKVVVFGQNWLYSS